MRTKLISLLLTAALICGMLCALPMTATAADSGKCGGNLIWTFDNGTLTIDGTGDMNHYDSYWYPRPWRDYCDSITTIQINEGVKSIGGYAFCGCSSLTSITIPNSLTSITSQAFWSCSALTSITIPNGVTFIDSDAFQGCRSLTDIYVNENNQNYASVDGILYTKDKTGLIVCPGGKREIEIFNGVTSIEKSAFYGCKSLTNISIPDSVTSIRKDAFLGCSALTGITIPNSVTSIGEYAFEDCTSLADIAIPSSVTSIENNAFDGCSSLGDIHVDENNSDYTSVDGVLYNKDKTQLVCCPRGKKEVEIYNGVTSIEDHAFYGCKSLTNISIPDGVTRIGKYAFFLCNSLVDISLPDSVTSIGDEAFGNCKNLTSVTLPSSVMSINDGAFSGCKSLTNITIPNSVRSINQYMFYGCESLTSITIPEGVTVIGGEAFVGCTSLTSITIPDSVTSIGYDAFKRCGDFTIHGYKGSCAQGYANRNKIPFAEIELSYSGECGDNLTWILNDSDTLIISGTGDMWDYYTYSENTISQPWRHYYDRITAVQIDNGVTSIGNKAFAKCSSLTSVTLPESVTNIDYRAFYGCSSLTDITIPNSVTSIEDYAFGKCENLTSVTIPSSVTSIKDDAFEDCPLLTIYGCSGSYAQKYADENNIKFVTGMKIGDKVFSDVDPGAWYESAVKYAITNSVFSGMSETTFEPNTAMSRAMLVQVLYNLEGNPLSSEYTNPFSDVKDGQWYADAVKWAVANGVVYGTTETAFSPNDKITREQLSTILYRYSQKKGYDVTVTAELASFPDGDKVSGYAEDAIKWAVGVSLISGNKIGGVNMLDARGDATRAQVAMILMKFSATVAK